MSQQMRILLVGPAPPPVGGMATVVQNLLGEYAKHADVRLINTAKTTDADRPLAAGIAAQLRLVGQLIKLLATWRPHAVHIHTCSFFTFWRNCLDIALARLFARRVFLHVHGGRFNEFLEGLDPVRQFLARMAMRSCRRIIVLGENWRELLAPWSPQDRTCVVANGGPLPERTRRSVTDRWSVICLANYEHLKGQEDLIRAVRDLQDEAVSVDFYGGATQAGEKERLMALVRAYGLEQRVRINDPISGESKTAAMRAASCFCLPSYVEGLPMSMLEAMGAQLPVIVTDVGAIPDVVSPGVSGLMYTPGDVAALVSHLETLRSQPDLAAGLGEAGRQVVESTYSLESSVEKLLRIFAADEGVCD